MNIFQKNISNIGITDHDTLGYQHGDGLTDSNHPAHLPIKNDMIIIAEKIIKKHQT